MTQRWRCTLQVNAYETKLLVGNSVGDLLKARMDTSPQHPRALLTLLEGLSLWSGYPLRVALSVDDSCPEWPDRLLGDFCPHESQLVHFDLIPTGRRRRDRGDQRSLRLRLRVNRP
jgi:hypothetical protein